MAQFVAVSNRKGGVGKSTIAVMLAHAAAAWSGRRVLVMDLDTQCNASLMLIGGGRMENGSPDGPNAFAYLSHCLGHAGGGETAECLQKIRRCTRAPTVPRAVRL